MESKQENEQIKKSENDDEEIGSDQDENETEVTENS